MCCDVLPTDNNECKDQEKRVLSGRECRATRGRCTLEKMLAWPGRGRAGPLDRQIDGGSAWLVRVLQLVLNFARAAERQKLTQPAAGLASAHDARGQGGPVCIAAIDVARLGRGARDKRTTGPHVRSASCRAERMAHAPCRGSAWRGSERSTWQPAMAQSMKSGNAANFQWNCESCQRVSMLDLSVDVRFAAQETRSSTNNESKSCLARPGTVMTDVAWRKGPRRERSALTGRGPRLQARCAVPYTLRRV